MKICTTNRKPKKLKFTISTRYIVWTVYRCITILYLVTFNGELLCGVLFVFVQDNWKSYDQISMNSWTSRVECRKKVIRFW